METTYISTPHLPPGSECHSPERSSINPHIPRPAGREAHRSLQQRTTLQTCVNVGMRGPHPAPVRGILTGTRLRQPSFSLLSQPLAIVPISYHPAAARGAPRSIGSRLLSLQEEPHLNSEPFKPVAVQCSGQFEQNTRITRGLGPIQE